MALGIETAKQEVGVQRSGVSWRKLWNGHNSKIQSSSDSKFKCEACRLWQIVGESVDFWTASIERSSPSWSAFVSAIRRQLLEVTEKVDAVEKGFNSGESPPTLLRLHVSLQVKLVGFKKPVRSPI